MAPARIDTRRDAHGASTRAIGRGHFHVPTAGTVLGVLLMGVLRSHDVDVVLRPQVRPGAAGYLRSGYPDIGVLARTGGFDIDLSARPDRTTDHLGAAGRHLVPGLLRAHRQRDADRFPAHRIGHRPCRLVRIV